RNIQVLFTTLALGIILFGGAIIGVLAISGKPGTIADPTVKKIFVLIGAGIAVICLLFSAIQYNKDIEPVKNSSQSATEKLTNYRVLMIKFVAPCEGAALFGNILFFLTGIYYVLGIPLIMLIAIMAKAPFKKKVIRELQLNWNEQQELE